MTLSVPKPDMVFFTTAQTEHLNHYEYLFGSRLLPELPIVPIGGKIPNC